MADSRPRRESKLTVKIEAVQGARVTVSVSQTNQMGDTTIRTRDLPIGGYFEINIIRDPLVLFSRLEGGDDG